MLEFCIQQWHRIALLIVASIWIVIFPIWSDWVTKEPLDVAIFLSPPSSIKERIEIRVPERYMLQLMFERDGVEFKQLKKLIGAGGVCIPNEECSKGVPVPIRWSLKSVETGTIVSAGEVESIDSDGWSAAHVYRAVGIVQVKPAQYLFNAEIIRPVPELAHIRTHIAIQHQPKASATWQMGLVWWGSIGKIFLAWPTAIYAVILLLWHANRAINTKSMNP